LSRDRKRLYFEKFASKSGFDPLVPENWYSIPIQENAVCYEENEERRRQLTFNKRVYVE
jgi:hypothetical protein